ncbi:unnamed protein product, partial [Laminaria digitata]
MVNVRAKRCALSSCTKHPNFNFRGSKRAVNCKQHSEEGMVNIYDKYCSHDGCGRFPSWGAPNNNAATVCALHK